MSFSFQTFVTTILHLCLVCAPLCLGLTVLNANINSAMTNAVHDQDTGNILVGLGMNPVEVHMVWYGMVIFYLTY